MLIIMGMAAVGCRETEPPPTHFEDLGTDGSPLLPTSPVWQKAAIAGGQAEWHPFRDPAIEPTLEEEDGDDEEDDAKTATDGDEVETEIRALIDEFNELVDEATADEILEYFVVEQAEALKPIVEAASATTETLEFLQGELGARLPDAADRINNAMSKILADMSLALRVSSVNVKSDTEVDVSVDGGVIAQDYRLVIVDEEWYIEVAEADELGKLASALDAGLKYYRNMLEGVGSESVPAEDGLKALEAAASKLAMPASAVEDADDDTDD